MYFTFLEVQADDHLIEYIAQSTQPKWKLQERPQVSSSVSTDNIVYLTGITIHKRYLPTTFRNYHDILSLKGNTD